MSETLFLKPRLERKTLESVVVHFAGDSGDGMQITGTQLTNTTAFYGNDVQTLPDFPAEIRAPAGTLAGVSGFQLRFADTDIHTPGDAIDVLVAMNPAACHVALEQLKPGATVILDADKFTDKDHQKAGIQSDLKSRCEARGLSVVEAPMTKLTLEAVKDCKLSRAQARKCKNMFALGVVYWLFDRPMNVTLSWLEEKFSSKPEVAEANQQALKAGYQYAIAAELFQTHYQVAPARFKPGLYRQMTGNQAFAYGTAAVAALSEKRVMLAGYPITPASDILHLASALGDYGVDVVQAEDEIAAAGIALGAAYAGGVGITSTSGPGLDLKAEMIGLAVMAELPLVIIDVQRAGPSTGMPTKTEQSDLLAAYHGRHGESPVPVLAPKTPGDCFYQLIEAVRIAQKHMTPVIVLSDGYLANGAEPWRLPDFNDLPSLSAEPAPELKAYDRNPETLARTPIRPGTPGKAFRLGGLEKDKTTGNISYDANNHESMSQLRANKLLMLQKTLPAPDFHGEKSGNVLVVSWGSVYGSALSAVESLQKQSLSVSLVHLSHLNPMPPQLETYLKSFKQVLVPELNQGQLCQLLRSNYLVDAKAITQMTGKPFAVEALRETIASFCQEVRG